MWTYEITTGAWKDPSGKELSIGYSGHGMGKNNPDAQSVREQGPIPEGFYVIGPFFDDPGGKGPLVAHLYATYGTETHGRSGFMLHGDSIAHPGTASLGCAIANYETRLAVSKSTDNMLHVVRGPEVVA